MLLKIGEKQDHQVAVAEARDPLELLLACHDKIRDFGALALKLARSAGAPPRLVGDAAGEVHRYHALGLPLHQADEETSIRPRLEASGCGPVVEAALARMTEQHVVIDAVLAELCPLWVVVRDEPRRLAELAPRLEMATVALLEQWDAHLTPEETVIFPAIRAVLTSDAQASILDEIKARRGAVQAAGGFSIASAGKLG